MYLQICTFEHLAYTIIGTALTSPYMLNAPASNARHSVMTFRMKTGRLRKDVVEKTNITSKMDMMKEFIIAAMSRNDKEYCTAIMKTVPGGGRMASGIWEDMTILLWCFRDA